jgi:hypothetical protein
VWKVDHAPVGELVGLVEAVSLLENRISDRVAECRKQGHGTPEIARVPGVHRAMVYRLSIWRE